jgi:hypothetical protein
MRQIQLPEDLCRRIEEHYSHQFSNIEACLRFILERLANDQSTELDRVEEQIVEQRLRDLGYV